MTTTLRTIESEFIILSINSDGIGQMHFKDNITFDIPEQMEHLKNLIEITNGQKTPFVVTAGENVTITKDARDNAIVIEDDSPVCASAIVVQNLAYKLLAEFYIKIQKPKQPYKIFTNQDSAFEWCKQFVK